MLPTGILVLAFILGLGAFAPLRVQAQTFSVIYNFTGKNTDGGYPLAGFVIDSAGNLYGTVSQGGASWNGAVIKVTQSGQESLLYSFTGGTDGSTPEASLLMDSQGNLYGTTYAGGANGLGTVFKVSSSGQETLLYSFAGGTADGANPQASIILDDADLSNAVHKCVQASFRNAGQSCNAPTRLLVPRSKMSEAIAAARQSVEATKVGDPFAADTAVGPLASKAQFEKVQGYIRKGIEEGATLVGGGPGVPDGMVKGYFVKPTVFADVRNDMTIAREEIFGPVLCIIAYVDDDDAIRIANDTPYGLSGFVTSGNIERARAVAKRIRSGNVHINDAKVDFSACFGGFKQSGNGREWGASGLEEFLELKAMLGYGAK